MSNQRRGNRSPARVQVFFFEKKVQPPRATVADCPHSVAGESATSPTLDLPEAFTAPPAQPGRAARRPTRGGSPDASRHTTEKLPAISFHSSPTEREIALVPACSAPAARPAPSRVATPSPIPGGCARDALEYHRLKLQQLAARGGGPTHFAEKALFGHTLYARGRMREAQVVFESIVAKEPDEAFAYTMLGAVYLSQNDDGRALALFDAALGLDPRDLAALVGRGEIRLRRGQPQAALLDLEQAIAVDPGGRDPFSERARALLVLARTLCRALR
ncbi:MAG: tetratricopeptide repeat protein [Deltaproteobacteria bacterium]|nr:tetratricopeptide repeat protein [Deltaproteobacteria bacterium]